MTKKERKKMHIASCSFGKDSIATILLALENNEPLDRAVFVEVMFDHERGISGEIPEHIEWIHNTAIPRLESMGVKVDVVRAKDDYVGCVTHILKKGKNVGKTQGFPIAGRCKINSLCKTRPLREYYKKWKEEYEITQYVGIAVDEPVRLARLHDGKTSLLAKYGYTEQMAMDKCKEYNLVSPCYSNSYRGGCWCCPNAKISELCHLRRHHPKLWEELKKLDLLENRTSNYFKYDKTLADIEKAMDQKEWNDKQPRLFDIL
jgi:3'-phosphoadenosine 5'-phosphosulfate sulfotransferase (PAPS reductase)/FAD synthetase